MNFFQRLKPKNWGIIKVYRDFENFADWRKTIKKEEKNKKSLYNKYNLSRTKLYDVYVIISLDDIDAQLSEMIQRTKVLEILNPINRYLDNELGFAECLDIELNQFDDDEGTPTLSYLIVYRFHFSKFSLLWILKFILVNIALIFVIFYFDLIPLLISWISNLI